MSNNVWQKMDSWSMDRMMNSWKGQRGHVASTGMKRGILMGTVEVSRWSYKCLWFYFWQIIVIYVEENEIEKWARLMYMTTKFTCAPWRTWLQFDASLMIMDSFLFTFFSCWTMCILFTRVSNICNKLYINLPKQ